MILTCLMLAFLPAASSPEAEGVSSQKVMKWLDACDEKIDWMHGFVFLRHGKLVAEGSWAPFRTLEEPHRLSSHSKCFITTAVGFLVEEGKLDLDARVVDFVADKLPPKPSENLKAVRIRDLLTMNFGTVAGNDEHWHDDLSGDWVKAILAGEITKRPGLHYEYDSGATHLLGFIVSRVCGMPVEKFLKERLFAKLGIEKAWMTYDPCGNACAAWGYSMTTREISLIGQLYLNKGLWNGERLFSKAWADLATAKHSWSGQTPTEFQPKNDWTYGFGFNWWRCQHDCYRADGSGGQYTIVFPEQDAVLSIHAGVLDMQKILDVVWDDFLPVFSDAALPPDPAAAAALKKRCAELRLPTVAGKEEGAEAWFGKEFTLKSAPIAIRKLRIDKAATGWTLKLTTAVGTYDLPVGFNEWKFGSAVISDRKYEVLGDPIGTQRLAASGAVQDDGSLKVRLHFLGGQLRTEFTFCKKFFKPTVEGMIGTTVVKAEW